MGKIDESQVKDDSEKTGARYYTIFISVMIGIIITIFILAWVLADDDDGDSTLRQDIIGTWEIVSYQGDVAVSYQPAIIIQDLPVNLFIFRGGTFSCSSRTDNTTSHGGFYWFDGDVLTVEFSLVDVNSRGDIQIVKPRIRSWCSINTENMSWNIKSSSGLHPANRIYFKRLLDREKVSQLQ